MPVLTSARLTLACGTTAPEASRTVPVKLAKVDWADSRVASRLMPASTAKRIFKTLLRCFMASFLLNIRISTTRHAYTQAQSQYFRLHCETGQFVPMKFLSDHLGRDAGGFRARGFERPRSEERRC